MIRNVLINVKLEMPLFYMGLALIQGVITFSTTDMNSKGQRALDPVPLSISPAKLSLLLREDARLTPPA